MRSTLLLLGAGFIIGAAPAPSTLPVRTPPPVFNPVPVAAERGTLLPPVPIKVAVYLGRETLWSGTLSVGSVPARLSLNEAVPIEPNCEPGFRGFTRNIEVTLNRQMYQSPDRFSLSARYSRPSAGGICPIGTRQVSVEQVVSLSQGGVTVEGDGGFRVTLTR